MEIANNTMSVIVHYNVVNGGDKRGNAQASTVIYRMEIGGVQKLFDIVYTSSADSLILVDAYRKQRGEWREVFDTVNLGNVTYIEWPKNMFENDGAASDKDE